MLSAQQKRIGTLSVIKLISPQSKRNELALSIQSHFPLKTRAETEEECQNILGRITAKSRWISIKFFFVVKLRSARRKRFLSNALPQLGFGLKVDFTFLCHISVNSLWISLQFFLSESLGRREHNVHVGATKTAKIALPQLEFGFKVGTGLQTSSEH